jgi:LysM repeat protein
MPDGNSYTVRSGDSLSKIAGRLGTTVTELQRLNGIADANRISVGQVLMVPGSAGAPSGGADAAAPPAAGGSDDWAALIEAHGHPEAKADFAAGKPVMIALRKSTSFKANAGRGTYDDRMIVVRRDNGAVRITEFLGNTEPSGQYARDGAKGGRFGVDIDKDGKKELGRLLAGNYRYERQPGVMAHGIGGAFFRATKIQASQRDCDNDGRIGPGDMIDPTGAQRSMLIHRGGSTNTFSAGCQTIPPQHYDDFLNAIGGQTSFSYILIDQD